MKFLGEVKVGLHSPKDVEWDGRPFHFWFKPIAASKRDSISQLTLQA